MNPSRIGCFGELLLRLTAPEQLLLSQASELHMGYAGAEANVAVALARAGHEVNMISVVPDNALGQRAREELRKHGVDTSLLYSNAGRMGLYFLTPGAAQRPTQIIYDRAQSAFAESARRLLNPDQLLQHIDWLHTSGVTTALSAELAALILTFMQAARAKGAKTSFDCNYRAKLWKTWDGDAATIFRGCAELANVLFADARSLALILGRERAASTPADAFGALSEQALKQFASLEYIICTHRIEHSVNHHELGARLRSRTQLVELKPASIQDRIGTGDAFAAGFLHALFSGKRDADALGFALAAGTIKHAIRGDFNLASIDEIEQLRGAGSLSVQR